MRTKAAPTPKEASTIPPTAGPAKAPTDSIVDEETFAAVNSSGVRASAGRSDDSAGWNAIPQIGPKAAMTNTICHGKSANVTAAISATSTARVKSAPSITRSRGNLSPRPETNGPSSAAGRLRMRAITPTAAAPPWSYAKTARAIEYEYWPATEPIQANCSRRRFGLWKTPRNAPSDRFSPSTKSAWACEL